MTSIAVIKGKVIRGDGRGKLLGFPTINLAYKGKLSGVFMGEVLLKNNSYLAAVNVGTRPTFDDKSLVEIHVVGQEIQANKGEEIKLTLLKKIREIKKFASPDDLKKQISEDVKFAKNCYNEKV